MSELYQGIIFDVDGVLEFKGQAYPGAVDLLNGLRRKGVPIRILSNSTLKSRKSCTEKLNKRGFEVFEEEVVTASYATAQYLKTLNPRSCWVLLKREGLDEFRDFQHDMENPEYVVLGDYREDFNFVNLNKALKLISHGSKLVVMITEITDNSMGDLELTVGAYGQMLENAAGVKGTWIGKPNKYIFDIALRTMEGIGRNKIVMIGDKIGADILGAQNAGIKSVLIKSGEFKESDLQSPIRPDYVFDSIKEVGKLFGL